MKEFKIVPVSKFELNQEVFAVSWPTWSNVGTSLSVPAKVSSITIRATAYNETPEKNFYTYASLGKIYHEQDLFLTFEEAMMECTLRNGS